MSVIWPARGPDLQTKWRSGHTRMAAFVTAGAVLAFVLLVVLGAVLAGGDPLAVDPMARSLSPSLSHPFGTDMLGRDMAARTLAALGTSLGIGLAAAAVSTVIALLLGVASTVNGLADRLVGAATELALGLPHLVLLLLFAYALGGGVAAVAIAIALTHWPRLSRVIRAETLTLTQADFVQVSARLGRSRLWIARHHFLPHLLPQLVAGFVLIFPHAILHEAALSFLGVGVEPHMPSIGVMLAESLRGLSAGLWWIALFPGLALMALAISFEVLGEALRRFFSIGEAQT